MYSDISKEMEGLFQYASGLKFSKKTYEDNFKEAFEKHRELFAKIIEACEKAEDRDAVIVEIAGVIPEKLERDMAELSSKRKREMLQLDYNTVMVTYFIPLITYSNNEHCERIADHMVTRWNETATNMNIRKAKYEEIQGGFRSKLCYVTTAVCESLQKPDDCYELTLLRDYRDGYLMSSPAGEAMVKEYYDIAPTIVKRINKTRHPEEIYSNIWQQYLQPCVGMIESKQPEACRRVYTQMVRDLQKTYLHS